MSFKAQTTLFFILLSAGATGADARHASTRKYKRHPIIKLTIAENAAVDPVSSAPEVKQCSGFVVTPEIVKRYFRSAFAITQMDTHDYQWSRCMATGRVEFANGDKGTWKIKSSRLGFLTDVPLVFSR